MPNKKSAGPDGLSAFVIKGIRDVIAPLLTIAINQSLTNGIFPSKLKQAKVIPLYKNKGEDTSFGNYRPISLLNVISKIFERVVFNQIYHYFLVNNLLFGSQYGFRTRHSTEDAAIELVDQIHRAFENDMHDQVLAVFLDLSKAFDTIDHEILLKKLSHYGVIGEALDWFRSYLTDRTQFVLYDDTESELQTIRVGVPQGSLLGPLLFLIYINDAHRASDALKFIHFADDTTLSQNLSFFSGVNNGSLTQSQLERRINVELKFIHDWLCVNKLSLNVSKTRSMVFKNPRLPMVSQPFVVEIDGEKVKYVSEFNFLGVTLDEFLTWTPHTKRIQSKISRSLGVIKRVRKLLPRDKLITLYNSLILPHFNFGVKLWGTNLKLLSTIQKRAVRVVTNSSYFAHTSGLFKEHFLLKLEDIYKVQCLKLHHKIENGRVPEYFRSFTTHNRDIHQHFTRGRNNIIPTRIKSPWLRHSLPDLVLATPAELINRVYTSSLETFSFHLKLSIINQYETVCTREPCLVCGRHARD